MTGCPAIRPCPHRIVERQSVSGRICGGLRASATGVGIAGVVEIDAGRGRDRPGPALMPSVGVGERRNLHGLGSLGVRHRRPAIDVYEPRRTRRLTPPKKASAA